MKNDKGITLIEIIIVVAILAIFAGSAIGGMNYIRYGNTKNCAYEINAALDKVRMEAMSKKEKPFLYIYKFGDSYYMRQSTAVATADFLNNTGSRLGNSQMNLSYVTTTSASDIVIGDFDSGNYMKLSFEKSTGGVSPMGSSYYNKIIVKDSDGTIKYTINLIKATGKHFIEG